MVCFCVRMSQTVDKTIEIIADIYAQENGNRRHTMDLFRQAIGYVYGGDPMCAEFARDVPNAIATYAYACSAVIASPHLDTIKQDLCQ